MTNNTTYSTVCPVCGCEFQKRRSNHLHCRSRCTLTLHRIRRKALTAFYDTLLSLQSKASIALLLDGMTQQKEGN